MASCAQCDVGTQHVRRTDGEYHWVGGLLVRVGSLTERRMLALRAADWAVKFDD